MICILTFSATGWVLRAELLPPLDADSLPVLSHAIHSHVQGNLYLKATPKTSEFKVLYLSTLASSDLMFSHQVVLLARRL